MHVRVFTFFSVLRRYIDENALRGLLPSELGKLEGLQNLDCSDNLHTGSIPTEIGSLGESLLTLYVLRDIIEC